MTESMNFLNAIMDGNEEAMHYATYLYEQAARYRWHDLRENPTDIPTDSGDYLCRVEGEYYPGQLVNEYCVVEWHNGKWYTGETIYYDIDVIAWREIEPFEVSK